MALPAPPGEEGKMLSEALSIVKIQTQQMKRHLVSLRNRQMLQSVDCFYYTGNGPTYGRVEECEYDAGRTAHFLTVAKAIL